MSYFSPHTHPLLHHFLFISALGFVGKEFGAHHLPATFLDDLQVWCSFVMPCPLWRELNNLIVIQYITSSLYAL